MLLVIAVLVLLIATNALYVAAEFATIGARRTRVSELASQGNGAAKRLLPYVQDRTLLDRYIAACQVGITLSSIVVGFYGQAQLTPVLTPWLGRFGGLEGAAAVSVATVLVLVVLTGLQVVWGELLPKSVAIRFPERLALATTAPMVASLFVLRPLIALLNGSAFALMRLLRLPKGDKHSQVHSPEELELLFDKSAQGGLLDAGERDMLRNVLHFEDTIARQIMLPRTRVEAVPLNGDPGEQLGRLARSAHTRFPVVDGSLDHIVGVIHLRDLYALARQDPAGTIESIRREIPFFPEFVSVGDLWRKMRDAGQHMAVIFDEYGGTAGIVTVEDILEEVFGELQDEFDREAELIRYGPERVFLRGDAPLLYVNDQLLLNLPDEHADTVGGLVIDALERVAKAGDEVEVAEVTLTVEKVEGHAVTQVSMPWPLPGGADAGEREGQDG